jgi:CHAT domain-containing protein/tetratricopeptide (TPR) repeat protein
VHRRFTLWLAATVLFFGLTVSSHDQTWQELLEQADSLSKAQNLDSAIALGKLALEKVETEFGSEDTVVARVVRELGLYYKNNADYVEAEALYKRALTINEKIRGVGNENVAEVLDDLGILCRLQGRYGEAEPLYRRALEIRERIFGPEHEHVAKSLNCLGSLFWYQAKYAEAESFFQRALAIREKVFGPEHIDVAVSLYNISFIFESQGKYSQAESALRRALAIVERIQGAGHTMLTALLNRLATLYKSLGRYADAELLYRQVLEIREEKLGPEHPDVAEVLYNLANLYRCLGKYSEAEPLYQRALEIRQKKLGSDHRDVGACLGSMGANYYYWGKYAQAEPLLKRSLTIAEKSLGSEHPDVAMDLNNLAVFYDHQKKYIVAEPLFTRALGIWEKALGPEHPNVALGLSNLALLCDKQGRYEEAESLYQRALDIREKILGSDHYYVAECLELYSGLQRRRKHDDESLEMAHRAVRIRRRNFVDNAMVLSEKDALAYSQRLRNSVDNYLSCFVNARSSDPDAIKTATDIIFSSKGQVFDGIFKRQKALVTEMDSTTLALAESLRFTRFQLSKLFVEGPGDDLEDYRSKVDSLAGISNDLETNLSRYSASFRRQQEYENIDADRISSLLPDGSVLVEYVKYNYLQLRPDSAIPQYLMVVVARSREPVIIELGAASEIDPLIDQYRQHMMDIASTGRLPTTDDLGDYERINQGLYEKVWKPVENQLSQYRKILIAPDGGLNMISFAGLIDGEGKYLIERFAIHYLSSGRDLIRLKDRVEPGAGLFALGDPDYNASAQARLLIPPDVADTAAGPDVYATRNVRSGCGALRDEAISPLPGTRDEVNRIAAGWSERRNEPVSVYLGTDASEEIFKARAPGSRVIHLATHGFFLEGFCQSELPDFRTTSEGGFAGENPLLLSGLFLAGANLRDDSAGTGTEDGVLTAYEVSGMDLEGTDLAILSACETALGTVQQGEGVYGLRRAFQIAGARTVISSLWQVPDDITVTIMTNLYDLDREEIPQALRSASLNILKRLRKKGQPDHPYLWAAFIATGDWRCLK